MEIIKIGLNENFIGEPNKSPDIILENLRHMNMNEKGKFIDFNNLNIQGLNLEGDSKEIFNSIRSKSKSTFEKNFKSFFIGGSHSMSYPIVESFSKSESNPLIIIFDAHADCLNPSIIPSDREWIRALIDSGFSARKILLVGSRHISIEESEFIKKNELVHIKMDFLEENLEEVCDLIMERARCSSGFYISLDLDCVDPAFAPGVKDIEPGGLSSRDLVYMIKRLVLLNNFKGADISGLDPFLDVNHMTSKLGAKILSEMI